MRKAHRTMAIVVLALAILALGADLGPGGHVAPGASGRGVVQQDADETRPSQQPSAGDDSSTKPDSAGTTIDLGTVRVGADDVDLSGLTAAQLAPLDSMTTRAVQRIEPDIAAAPTDDGPGTRVLLRVQVPAGFRAQLVAEGSIALVDRSGRFRLGLGSPASGFERADVAGAADILSEAPDDAIAGSPWQVEERSLSGSSMLEFEVTQELAAHDGARRMATTWGTGLVLSSSWNKDGEGGESLEVTPSQFARLSPGITARFAMQSLKDDIPAASTSVMDKQLRCHALGARSKATWNLEPWRPDVSYAEYLIARCNPR